MASVNAPGRDGRRLESRSSARPRAPPARRSPRARSARARVPLGSLRSVAQRGLLAARPVERADAAGLQRRARAGRSSASASSPVDAPPSVDGREQLGEHVRVVAVAAPAARTVCASASATSRSSPFSADGRHCVRPRRGSRAARARSRRSRSRSGCRTPSARSSPTTSGRRAQARPAAIAPRARRAADRRVALVVERVVGHVVLAHVVPDLVLRPFGERVELDDRAVVVVDLDLADVGARRPLVAAQAGDPGVERREVPRSAAAPCGRGSRAAASRPTGRRGSARACRPSRCTWAPSGESSSSRSPG